MSEETNAVIIDDGAALVVRSNEELPEKLALMREAQKVFATFTQEQVDKIFFEAAMAANKARIPLAKMAVEETGIAFQVFFISKEFLFYYISITQKTLKTCIAEHKNEQEQLCYSLKMFVPCGMPNLKKSKNITII